METIVKQRTDGNYVSSCPSPQSGLLVSDTENNRGVETVRGFGIRANQCE